MANVFIILSIAILIAVLTILVRWARQRSAGAFVIGALFSVFAPDPTMAQKIAMVEKAKNKQNEEDEQDGD